MKYSENVREVLKQARNISTGLIEPNHILIGIILTENSNGYKMLESLIDINDAKVKIKNVYVELKSNKDDKIDVSMSSKSEQILIQSQLEAKIAESDAVCTEHLVLSLVKSGILEDVRYEEALDILNVINGSDKHNSNKYTNLNMGETKKTNSKSETPLLDEFSVDLTKLAEEGKLDPTVGRVNEMHRIAQVLSRRRKNNPVLIGYPGVGKTAIVEGLAMDIVNMNTPEVLHNKRILSLEMGALVAGTKYRGEFEDRMKKIVDELKKTDNIILYLDEMHTLVGAGSTSGSLDAANILKPALSRGEINCIGSTTLDEYRKIEKDGALERRFQKIMVNEPTLDETRIILHNLKSKYEEFHKVKYTDEAIESCLNLSDRYITERFFPDKAIDALDEAGSAVRITDTIPKELREMEKELQLISKVKLEKVNIQDFEGAADEKAKELKVVDKIEKFRNERKNSPIVREVVAMDIANVISTITGIPSTNISEDENAKFIKLAAKLKTQVIGQDNAVDIISKSILRNKAGLGDTKRPIGTFLFLGPTGVGKTYLAKKLAEDLFTSEKDMIRIDMSEYMEKHSVSRLVGAPPGYVGHDDGGQLTELVRRNPYSIILLDEIEKAHSDVTNILLQIFEDGILTDSQGTTVNFKNTVIIMTSNIGSREASERGSSVGFIDNSTALSKSIIDRELKKKFAPEFLNRVDNIVRFETLNEDNIKEIINLELDSFIKKLKKNHLNMVLEQSAKDFLFEKGWDADLGARPLKRAIQKYIEDEISIKLIMKEFVNGDIINVSKEDDIDILTFIKTLGLDENDKVLSIDAN